MNHRVVAEAIRGWLTGHEHHDVTGADRQRMPGWFIRPVRWVRSGFESLWTIKPSTPEKFGASSRTCDDSSIVEGLLLHQLSGYLADYVVNLPRPQFAEIRVMRASATVG